MYKPLEIFVGLRYTRAKRRNHFISFISVFSIVGMALGVMVVITVLSVMNGFSNEVRDRILSVVSHVTISGASDWIEDWQTIPQLVDDYKQIIGYAPYVQSQVMLSAHGAVKGALINGVLPEHEDAVSELNSKMKLGSLQDLKSGEFKILLGTELAQRLGLRLGDKVVVVTPQTSVSPVGIMPRLKRFTVAGYFEIGMHEYDSSLALVHMEDAARLFLNPDKAQGVRLKLTDVYGAPSMTQQLVTDLPRGYVISDWTQKYGNLFHALKLEKTMMFIVTALIVAVAAFNIVSTLVMVVTDKKADIAILRTLGASPGHIMRIFIVQGVVIGLFGSLLGVIGGVLLSNNFQTIVTSLENVVGTKFMPADVYYITDLPTQVQTVDLLAVAGVSFVLSLLATIYPAWRASRTQPAEALRYE